ncbi:MAG: TldD/PmbA family protein [Chloroflexi bacterium]|nr:TldD/PmbA family protein [Chloroflexota bacterium]
MRDLFSEAIKGHRADYIEIRVERGESTRITYRGKQLEDIARGTSLGGNVRALVKGGWGFVSFNDLSDLRRRVALAVREARLTGQKKSQLAEVEPVVDVVKAQITRDPTTVPTAEKKKLLDEYNEIVWSGGPEIQTSVVRYNDNRRTVYLATSQGTYIEQDKLDIGALILAIARKDGNVQQAFVSQGSNHDYGAVAGLHDEIRETTKHAIDLLSAPYAKAGEYTVIADPQVAGLFVHEAFGHLSEADHVYENERLREIMVLGKRFGGDHLNILDGAAVPGLRGSYKYDDEGTPATNTHLIKQGILVGRLHSRETAAEMGERPTGNARALNYRFRPIVRMTNTYIAPGTSSFEEMIADVKEGVYVKRATGGETAMEMFTFGVNEAYMIRNGQIAEPVQGVTLSGNVFVTLANIDAIGDDMIFHQSAGGCGKDGQVPLPVSEGSGHIRIRQCVVGGR